jgi:four helix bundle protein
MGEIRSHQDLEVWKNSVALVTVVYEMTEAFPARERFGLSNQMRRAAVSIPSNIAEGAGRFSPKEFVQFLYIASGSLAELETHLVIAHRLGYIITAELNELEKRIRLIRSQVFGLIRRVRKGRGDGVKK